MWRFIFLLGFLVTVKCENVAEQHMYWRDYNKVIPKDAVLVGFGLYIGQSVIDGILIPGTIYPKSGMFITEYNGKKEKIDGVKIMCSKDPIRFKWEYINVKDLPDNLIERVIVVGERNNVHYIGRAFHQNEWRIGKVELFDEKGLLIWNNDGTHHKVFNFEILTDTDKINENLSSEIYNFTLSVGRELDLQPEETKNLIKTAIWQIIYEIKHTNTSDIQISI